VVAQDEPFAFGPQRGGEAVAFFFGEDDAVEFLPGFLSVKQYTPSFVLRSDYNTRTRSKAKKRKEKKDLERKHTS